MFCRRLVFAAALVAVLTGGSEASAAEVLITSAEASLPNAPDGSLTMRGLTRGPGVAQVAPDPDGRTTSPLPLKIRFAARNNSAIDPASVRLIYLKSPAVDLTPRIQAHLTQTGIEIEEASVPPGIHLLRLELRDTQGRSTATTIKLSVAN